MLNKNHYKFLLITTNIFIFGLIFSYSLAATNINLTIEGCNNNYICEPPSENNSSCSNDCTSCNYNNVCQIQMGESQTSCSQDCRSRRSSPIYGVGGDIETPLIVEGKITNLNIKTGINYAIISWDTDVPAYGSVSWGIGDSYNDGVINSIKISGHQEMVIENLSASTTYYYYISASLPDYYFVSTEGTFTTTPIPEVKIIPSIYNFETASKNGEVLINWTNPSSDDFYGVKIVQSPLFFPRDPNEGKIIYEGSGNYARDSGLISNQKYYYSAFSYDRDYNYSSGVVSEVIFKPSATSTLDLGEKVLQPQDINNFIFIQDDLELPIYPGGMINVYPYSNFKIITDPNRFEIKIKTIILNLKERATLSKTYSYSFGFDPRRNIYYVIVPTFFNNNIFDFSIIAYDLNNKPIYVTEGGFNVKGINLSEYSPSIYSQILALYWYIIGFIINLLSPLFALIYALFGFIKGYLLGLQY